MTYAAACCVDAVAAAVVVEYHIPDEVSPPEIGLNVLPLRPRHRAGKNEDDEDVAGSGGSAAGDDVGAVRTPGVVAAALGQSSRSFVGRAPPGPPLPSSGLRSNLDPDHDCFPGWRRRMHNSKQGLGQT